MSIADFEYVSPRRTAYLFLPMRAGGCAKLIKKKQRYPGGTAKFTDDMFDWGSPPLRRPLLEIEMSQDEVAKRLSQEAKGAA